MEKDILALGSIVKLIKGERKIMITGRGSLYLYNEKEYYFDYSGCLYPEGNLSGNSIFFNTEDIEQICHIGYRDELDQVYCDEYRKQVETTDISKLRISDLE